MYAASEICTSICVAASASLGLCQSSFHACHVGVSCDVCGASPLLGKRFNSLLRDDWDCCTQCLAQASCSAEPLAVIRRPLATPVVAWPPWLLAAAVESPATEASHGIGIWRAPPPAPPPEPATPPTSTALAIVAPLTYVRTPRDVDALSSAIEFESAGRAWAFGDLGWELGCTPPDPAALFSEGGEVIKLQIEGSLTIPKTVIEGCNHVNTKTSLLKHWSRRSSFDVTLAGNDIIKEPIRNRLIPTSWQACQEMCVITHECRATLAPEHTARSG